MVPKISNALNLMLIISLIGAVVAILSAVTNPGVPDQASLDAALQAVFREQTSLSYNEENEIVISLLLLICLFAILISFVFLFMRKTIGIYIFSGSWAFVYFVTGVFWWNNVSFDIGFLSAIDYISTMADGAVLFICWYLPVEAGFAPRRSGVHPETAFN